MEMQIKAKSIVDRLKRREVLVKCDQGKMGSLQVFNWDQKTLVLALQRAELGGSNKLHNPTSRFNAASPKTWQNHTTVTNLVHFHTFEFSPN